VEVSFAQTLAQNRNAVTNDLELRFQARIYGNEEIWLAQHEGTWVHKWAEPPTEVMINGHPWDTASHPGLVLDPPLMPEVMDLQRATLTRVSGRGIMDLAYERERLCLDIEDPDQGADEYEAVVRVPRFRERHLVRVTTGSTNVLLGAPLNVYRFPASKEVYARLAGQRAFDMRGQCLVALEPGQYQFEVLHQVEPNLLAALKTGVLDISGPTNVDLSVRRLDPGLYGPDRRPIPLDELLVRSTRPCGAISWKAPAGPNPAPLSLLVSEGQSYKVHVFGHAASDYLAVWTTATSADFPKITLGQDQWLSCAFRWMPGSPPAKARGVVLQFADGQMELPETARFYSNRRFFNVAYWLAFEGERKACFQPRGCVLPGKGAAEVPLAGPLLPLASATIREDENHRPPEAKQIWWEITLADPQNYLLDTEASKIDWKPTLTTRDGHLAITAPLLKKDLERLGNLTDTLVAGASYVMGATTQHVSLSPATFVRHRTTHFFTPVPPYHDWNTRAYLAKAERELDMIARARQRPLAPDLQLELEWRLHPGLATGGGKCVTMPLAKYLASQDWFSTPWALGHEMLHTFGYGHSREMDRLSQDVDDQMARFQTHVADHPEYVPEGWDEQKALQ